MRREEVLRIFRRDASFLSISNAEKEVSAGRSAVLKEVVPGTTHSRNTCTRLAILVLLSSFQTLLSDPSNFFSESTTKAIFLWIYNHQIRNCCFYCNWLRWLPTFGKKFKLFLKPRFSEVKFNADSKFGKKKWVSRACFRDNQHLMEAYAGAFEERMASPEVIRTKVNRHKIIVLCRLNKCTNVGKWTIMQHQNECTWRKDKKIPLFFIFRPFGGLKNYHKVKQKSRQKAFFSYVQKISFS